MTQNAVVKSDFRATATHFVNIFVFLLIFQISGESSIACVEYSASKVIITGGVDWPRAVEGGGRPADCVAPHRPKNSNLQKCKNVHEMGRRSSKITFNHGVLHHFSSPASW